MFAGLYCSFKWALYLFLNILYSAECLEDMANELERIWKEMVVAFSGVTIPEFT
jgi:hypothetical protein